MAAASLHSSSSRPALEVDSANTKVATKTYRLLGVTFRCCASLPRLAPLRVSPIEAGDAGLEVCFAAPPSTIRRLNEADWQQLAPREPSRDEQPPGVRLARHRTLGHYRFRYRDGAAFLLRADGGRVWVEHPPAMSSEDICSYLLGPVFALVLRLRGIVCLHASAVCTASGAVAFLGQAHAGKSTLAASFALAGHPALSDDIATLVPEGGHFQVAPDAPYLNLWPRSAELLFGDADALPHLSTTWDKRFLALDPHHRCDRPQAQATPARAQRLVAIYELATAERAGAPTRILPHTGHRALITLVQYARAAALLSPAQRPGELEVLAAVVRSAVPIRRIERALHARPETVRDTILADLRALGLPPRDAACADR